MKKEEEPFVNEVGVSSFPGETTNLEFKIKKFKASGVDFVQVIGMALPAGTEVSFILPLNGMRGLAEAILEACDHANTDWMHVEDDWRDNLCTYHRGLAEAILEACDHE
jgi:hypothetical protein